MAAGVASVLIAGIVFLGFHVFQKKLLVSDSQEESLAPLKETFSFMIDGPDTNKQYSIRCHVFYFIANQASGDDSEFCCPSDNELMLWLKDSIYEEYAYYDGLLDYESLRENFLSGDFKQNITEKFISYIDDKVLDMDQSTQLGIDIMRVVVEPEGAFREDLEKAKQEPE